MPAMSSYVGSLDRSMGPSETPHLRVNPLTAASAAVGPSAN